ncbi:HIT family protein [Asticcacaulis sp. EMRT-3]|uniref:HIT family protein n=1 Tax=Asticcacaulis sp. EMRT-3 TaxID=3040349 RepID=UPI0024AEE6F8|nr:HIT family protein [Asticcacaulis sp. EMRT-3]MDI7774047.1 HIT family protein [Asticcacaulis sp. EMRT-3]
MTLDATYNPGNIFAKIISGDIPCARVYEDERILSFMDAFPQSKGHTLVIPKVAACNLFDIGDDDLQNLIVHTRRIARAVRDALAPDGLRIIQFNGEAAGQTVFHLHFHILPIWEGQTPARHGESGMADIEVLKATAARIAEKLARS